MTLWYQFFEGSVSSGDLHGLSRVPFECGVVGCVFSFLRVTASLFLDVVLLVLVCTYYKTVSMCKVCTVINSLL